MSRGIQAQDTAQQYVLTTHKVNTGHKTGYAYRAKPYFGHRKTDEPREREAVTESRKDSFNRNNAVGLSRKKEKRKKEKPDTQEHDIDIKYKKKNCNKDILKK